ncbi:MAG: UDP-N-acetylglucosamine 1-carboxyvinyltransferase [Clostridiales bacterium]|jgi:UDP-N-acetylglucosamine 1-carboxyvinyltransferase|nr:UDP-N-acetylglucosamine 1-carboxyvinyltransferase [Clostridiales bacterium]
MNKLSIIGKSKLLGEVCISGAKNSAVGIIPATILVDGNCRIENVPKINDVNNIANVLTHIEAKINFEDNNIVNINSSCAKNFNAPYDMVRKTRASTYFMGALLGRFKEFNIGFPGGCDFGVRPIDQHIKGFESLGAKVVIERGNIIAKAKKLKGAVIYLDVVSVGATINIILAATKAEGITVIENAAKEPHVVDIANFLNTMGGDIRGAGTDIIKIKGTEYLGGGTYSIIPDQIEAGTFMIAAAATNGNITIKNIIPKHLESITAKLVEIGANVEEMTDSIKISMNSRANRTNIKTLPYPGFPTDLQPQILTMMTTAKGASIINEGVWDNRFGYIDELRKMGANISTEGRIAVVEGIKELSGSPVRAPDLRGGAALVIAGLIANGVTKIYNSELIDRGYEGFEKKLKNLGAQIVKISQEETIFEEII